MKWILFANLILSQTSYAELKQAIICKKAENFDDALAQINGLLIEPDSKTAVEYTREDKTKGSANVSIKNFMYDTAHIQYFETKEKSTYGKNKNAREVTIYRACVPVQLNQN